MRVRVDQKKRKIEAQAARIQTLEDALKKAANHIDSAAEVINDLDGDIDGECEDARAFAKSLRELCS